MHIIVTAALGEVYSQILKRSCEDLQDALSITYPSRKYIFIHFPTML